LKNIKNSLPNTLTLINLSLGVMAILIGVKDSIDKNTEVKYLFIASLLIMLAALTDRLDGKVARMLNATSDLGKELDSLSDLISFGVAPIIVSYKISLTYLGIYGYLISLIFPITGAYRLARYNITEFDNVFRGIPITIAGAFLTINNLYHSFILAQNKELSGLHITSTAILVVLLSFVMISKIRFKKV
jgi:CDP-diacylglycerol--serine O-phosphatidyltransferase